MSEPSFQRLRTEQVLAWLATRPDALVLDARDVRHHAISHLAGCTLLDRSIQEALLRDGPKSRPVLIYCYHGNASQNWASMFGDFGFTDVADLIGGWAAVDRLGVLQGPQQFVDVMPGPSSPAEAAHASVAPTASSFPPALVAWLSAEGFDATQADAAGKHGNTPLMHAAWRGAADMVDALLAVGVACDAVNHDGNNALWLACVNGDPPLLRTLVASGVPLDHANLVGATALMYAASSGKHGVLSTLLELGANPHLQSQDDYTALDMVASLECLQILRASTRSPVVPSTSTPTPA
jgi:rhodanese-related sulfurtransferase